MDHQQATQLEAVEKYLLDELPPRQRAQFEEHFFNCQECATELRMTGEFLERVRKELARGGLGGHAPKVLKRSWLELLWRPAALAPACALLLAIIAYQDGVVLPRFHTEIAMLRHPGLASAVSLIGANSRGAGKSPSVSLSANQPVLLSLDIPATQPYPRYECVLHAPSGAILWRVPVSSAQAQDTVSISIPAGNLRPGDYTLIVQGLEPQGAGDASRTEATDLARYRFTVVPSQ